ncbi:MAG: heme A synthase [Nitrospinae bacterium]|nr:heme A synthase [Nitrospinota bacterium]
MLVKSLIGGSIVATYLLMVMGNLVTTTGSGLACPDWPLCYGTFVPPFETQIWFEWGHRLLGALAGFAILGATIAVWMYRSGAQRYLVAGALGLLGVGVLFGGVIVRMEAPLLEGALHLFIVSFHIVLSTIIFSLMIMAWRKDNGLSPDPRAKFYVGLFLLTFGQVILGIIVRYGHASMACPDFPTCQGSFFPSLTTFEVTVHFVHRMVAYTIFLVASGYLFVTFKSGIDRIGGFVTFTLILFQASWGIGIVQSGMFLPLIVLHGATGFALLGWLAYRSAPGLLLSGPAAPAAVGGSKAYA